MRVTHSDKSTFPYIVIDDIYDEKELSLINTELNFIVQPYKYTDDAKEYGAKYDDGVTSKVNNYSIWLDDVYNNRIHSDILRINRKIFDSNIYSLSSSWHMKRFFEISNYDKTLISYYDNGGFYDYHSDQAAYTAITWFYKEPKKFSGGDLSLRYENESYTIECMNNRTLVFPSMIEHSVSEIIMEDKDSNKGNGRYSMIQFVNLI